MNLKIVEVHYAIQEGEGVVDWLDGEPSHRVLGDHMT
jgi:hypothetical protein